jgi:CIC family chloride channel protein
LGRVRAQYRRVRVAFLRAEFRIAPTEQQRLFILTLVIGVVCGLTAVAFHLSIKSLEHLLITRAMAAKGSTWIVWTVATPALGGLVAGLVLQYLLPGARGSGIPQVKVAFAERDGEVPLRDALGKFALASLQIGSGASLGREGPTVHICSGVARALGRLGRLSTQSRRRLIPVGAAAGIAAAFNAPIAAVTFTIEEIVGKLDQTVLSGVIVAAALAAVIERSILGENPVLGGQRHYSLTDARSLVFYAALGVAAAAVSIAFTDGLLRVRKRFREQRSIPPWAQPAVGGALTGALAVAAMLALRTGGVNGGGYDVLKEALSSNVTVKVMLVLCAVKLAATVASYSSGGAGGIFAPSLFIGAMLGGAFGALDRVVFHHPQATLGAFALVGMGAVFSGTIRAPMTSVLIIIEMTSGYELILPLMIANMSSYAIARAFRPQAIYDALLAQDGVHIEDEHRATLDALERLRLADVLQRGTIQIFSPRTSAAEMLRIQHAHATQRVFPVIDDAGKLRGVVPADLLSELDAETGLEHLVTAADVAVTCMTLRVGDDMRVALEVVRGTDLAAVPVLDENGHVVGLIDESTVAHAYLKATAPRPRQPSVV